MVLLFVGLALFFAVRSFLYFRGGRTFAGILTALACCLFLGAIYTDFAKKSSPDTTEAVAAQ